MDSRNFFIPHVFEVKESIFHSFTELPFSDVLANLGQLPVLRVLEGTDDWVLWIFVISLFPTFSRSRNQILTVSQSYHVRMTSKIQVNFRFYRCSRALMIGFYGFLQIPNSLRFQGRVIHFFAVSQSYHILYHRPHHQFLRVLVEPEVDLDFRGHS